MAIGREAVGGATVGREPALVHRGGRERLRSVQCATAIYNAKVLHISVENKKNNLIRYQDAVCDWFLP